MVSSMRRMQVTNVSISGWLSFVSSDDGVECRYLFCYGKRNWTCKVLTVIRHSNLQNNSSTPDFFTSPRALWQYGYTLDPNVPTSEGSMEGIPVYESSDEKDGMLFPIHQACLDLVDRICQFRYEHSKTQASAPKTLQDFCDVLSRRRSDNLNDFWRIQKDQYYANCGGIEWDHEYYGAKQFWADEWNSMPGWEVGHESMRLSFLLNFYYAD